MDLAAYLVFFLVIALNFALLCLGLCLQWGFTGLFNVGVAGFFAIGAYTTAILTGPDYPGQLGGFGLPVPAGWLGGMATAALVALGVGALTLRLRQDYLAIATFGIAIVIQLLALNLEPVTGGAFGLGFIPRPLFGRAGSPATFNLFYLILSAALVGLVWLALEALVRGPWGRVLRAIREDETAAQALGKAVLRFRLESFAIGSAVMGLAGGLYASFTGFIAPQDFQSILTFQVWAMLIVGGSGSFAGAILGAVGVWALWTASGAVIDQLLPAAFQVRGAALQIVLIGVVLAVTLLLRPRGLIVERTALSVRAADRPFTKSA
jgi:branched-chain amino acid transport system permease protein